jgi:hypothetical protein
LDWGFHYNIGNLVRHKYPKWAHMIHLNTYNASYYWKKNKESKCQFDFRPLKFRNLPSLNAWRGHATYCWKALDEGSNFALNLILIRGFQKKLWASKMARVLISKISRLPTWESQEKWDLGATPMAKHINYYKGEGDGFPQIQTMVNLVSLFIPMACLCIKNVPTIHLPTCCLACADQ